MSLSKAHNHPYYLARRFIQNHPKGTEFCFAANVTGEHLEDGSVYYNVKGLTEHSFSSIEDFADFYFSNRTVIYKSSEAVGERDDEGNITWWNDEYPLSFIDDDNDGGIVFLKSVYDNDLMNKKGVKLILDNEKAQWDDFSVSEDENNIKLISHINTIDGVHTLLTIEAIFNTEENFFLYAYLSIEGALPISFDLNCNFTMEKFLDWYQTATSTLGDGHNNKGIEMFTKSLDTIQGLIDSAFPEYKVIFNAINEAHSAVDKEKMVRIGEQCNDDSSCFECIADNHANFDDCLNFTIYSALEKEFPQYA
jgi:hypothetical protein